RTKAASAAWATLARQCTAADVPALLESLTDGSWGEGYLRLVHVARWPADPRIEDALVRWLETVPYRSTSAPFYKAVLALASRIRNPALLPRLEAADALIEANVSATLGDWLRRQLEKLIADVRPGLATPTAPPSARLAAIDEALAHATQATAPRAEVDELLQAIYARPDDTARRLVYGDALLERGDARGELITLQCQAARTAEQQRRETKLLKEHGLTWLGELAPIIMKGYRFERGFLAECRIDSNKADRIRPLIGHPAWSTVRKLEDSAQIAFHPVMRSLRELVFRPNRARDRERLDDAWRELFAGTPRPIETLHLTDLDMSADADEQIAALGRGEALPALRELHVGGMATQYVDELLAGPIAQRLTMFGLVFDQLDELQPAVLQRLFAGSRIPAIVVHHPMLRLRIACGPRGSERATLEVHGRDATDACTLIAALPPTLLELRVATPPDLDRRGLLALTAATRPLTALAIRQIGPPGDALH
ncbi:MAG: TIGR02996 domain-containing protein, partial [Myxococcota bacterium]|nr:TIGR02996 domain-containing protein [Myxococcota bacterium]